MYRTAIIARFDFNSKFFTASIRKICLNHPLSANENVIVSKYYSAQIVKKGEDWTDIEGGDHCSSDSGAQWTTTQIANACAFSIYAKCRGTNNTSASQGMIYFMELD